MDPPSDQPRGSFRVWATCMAKNWVSAVIVPRVANE